MNEPPPSSPYELCWRCLSCGEVILRVPALPEGCPRCGAPATELVLVEED
jgi:rubrerythrin